MTDSDLSVIRIYECPLPDDCNFTAGGAAELPDHVNTEHSREYRRDDWPDTEAGQVGRDDSALDGKDEDELTSE